MLRLASNTTLLLLAALLIASRAEAQAPEPRAVDAARCTFDATAVLGAPSTSAAFSRDGSLLALYAPAGLALVRSEDCAIVASTTHPIEVHSVFASYPVQLVVTDRQRVAVVTAHDGAWLWEPAEPTVRRILEDRTTAIATHAGGEDIILEVDADSNATLLRLNVATGRVTHRRTLPTSELRGLENLGWDPRDGSLLALTDEGRLFALRASTLGRPVERRSYASGVERRLPVLTAEGELVYEALRERRPSTFYVQSVSVDGRTALLESFETYAPSAAPRRWMVWTPGTTLPMTVSGPIAEDAHRAVAVSSTGRTLVCATPTPEPAGSPPTETCWLVDL